MASEKCKRQTEHHNIRVSDAAYNYLKKQAKSPEFHGRGMVGVLDKLVFGDFSTIGAGRTDTLRASERTRRLQAVKQKLKADE